MAFGEGAARNPKTRPEKLARLAHSRNPSLRALVAQNPSTPETSLRELAADRVPTVVVGVASNPSAPTTVLKELSRNDNKDVRAATAGNPATPASALAQIVQARNATDVEKLAVARNPSVASSTLSDLMSRSYGSAEIQLQMRVAIASNPSASGGTLRDLFRRDEKRQSQAAINAALAGNPSTPLETRAELFGMEPYRAVVLGSEPIRATERRVASARAATGRTAEFLAHNPDPEMRRAVALSPGATRDVLTILANDAVPGVAAVALARITTDSSQLERYAASGDPMVLEGLIRNPDLPPALSTAVARASLSTAAEDSLMILAKQTSTPSHVLHALVTRPSWVSQWAASQMKQAVVANPAVAPATLAILATDEDKTIRAMLGKAQGLPMECLVRLTADNEETVRQAAASNSATPPELLLRLAKDDSASVVQAVAAHQEATGAVLERVVRDQLGRRKNLSPKSPYSRALPEFPLGPLVAAASNPNTPPDSLIVLADSVNEAIANRDTHSPSESDIVNETRVWAGIASNPSSPADLLDRVARTVHKKLWSKSDHPYAGPGSLEDVRASILSKIIHNPAVSIETLQFLSDGDWVARETTTESEREDGRTFTWTVWDDSATAAARHDMARSVKALISQRKWRDSASTADRLVFASNPDTARGILDELKSDSDVAVRCAVAANRSTPPDAFLRLSRDAETKVRLAAASATHPDSEFDRHGYIGRSCESQYGPGFEVLSTDHEPKVRAAVAANSGAFWEALSDSARSRMMFDSDTTVRAAIVSAISVKEHLSSGSLGFSAEALSHLIETGSPDVWRTLARRYGEVPVGILSQLAATGDPQTMASVAGDYHTTHELLLQLSASNDACVIEQVSSHVDVRHAGEADQEELVSALLANPMAPESFLELITSKWYFERRLERVRDEARESAMKESGSLAGGAGANAIMDAVHRASQRADEAAARIEADDGPLHRAVRHPNFPEASLVSHAAGTDARLIRAAAQSGNARALVAAASNENSPPEILQMLAESNEPRVRQALLDNKCTPPEVLVRLIQTGRG